MFPSKLVILFSSKIFIVDQRYLFVVLQNIVFLIWDICLFSTKIFNSEILVCFSLKYVIVDWKYLFVFRQDIFCELKILVCSVSKLCYYIAKGTTDPRVEFILQFLAQILIKLHLQNLEQVSTSKSQPNMNISSKIKF